MRLAKLVLIACVSSAVLIAGTLVANALPAKPTVTAYGTIPAGFPGPTNTGVPAGTKLSAYTGSCTIKTNNTIIDSKLLKCDLVIQAANVVIKNSQINGLVANDVDRPEGKNWSFTLQDSTVKAGVQERAAVSDGNSKVIRSNITGGITSVHCSENAKFCVVQDSWLHGQGLTPTAKWHLGGFQSNGGVGVLLRHNTVMCTPPANKVGEGCTGDINLIPDFATVSHATIDHNFLGSNVGLSYCTYGGEKSTSDHPHANYVTYTNNIFAKGTNGKCGAYGPVTSFNSAGTGNVWKNNVWADGSPVAPEN